MIIGKRVYENMDGPYELSRLFALRGSLSGFWLDGDKPDNSYEDVAEKTFLAQQQKAVQDILGYCSYVYCVSFDNWIAMATSAIGRPFTKSCLIKVRLQAHNLEKAFNTIHVGFKRKNDYPCSRYYNEPVKSGPYKGERIDHKKWDQLLDKHYELHELDK